MIKNSTNNVSTPLTPRRFTGTVIPVSVLRIGLYMFGPKGRSRMSE